MALLEWAFLRFIVGEGFGWLAYESFNGETPWVAAADLLGIVAYVIYIALGRGPVRNPLRWGSVSWPNVVKAVVMAAIFITARASHFQDVPTRLAEVLDFARMPHALSLCVLAPIKEELLYRGILLRRLSKDTGLWPGLVVSSLVFALMHPDPLYAGLYGLWLGIIYSPSVGANLVVPMLLHAVANLTLDTRAFWAFSTKAWSLKNP
jgi:membrane protease YdiL (CAAX protease family)